MSTPAPPVPPPSPAPSASPEPVLSKDPQALRKRQLPLYFWAVMALGLLLVYNLIFSPSFYSLEVANGRLVGNTINVLHYGSKVMLIALGMTLVIATGGIDLSVGAIMAIAGGVAALMISEHNVLTGGPHVPAPVWLAIAAGLDTDAGRRRVRQVGRHDGRGSTVERKGRLQHAAIAQRHELRLPRRIRGVKDGDRVGPARTRAPRRVRVACHAAAERLAPDP